MRSKIHIHFLLVIINTFILSAISILYFRFLPDYVLWNNYLYSFVAVIGQMGLLASLWGVVTLPIILINAEKLRRLLSAIVFSLPILALYIDTQVFAQYRYHIQWTLLEMLLSGGMVSFTYRAVCLLVAAIFFVIVTEFCLYGMVQKHTNWQDKPIKKTYYATLLFALIATHLTHIWANANGEQQIITQTRYLPLFYPATANRLMSKLGLIDLTAVKNQKKLKNNQHGTLKYPLHPLQIIAKKPVNIVVIAIDSWRFDALSAKYSPHIWQFAQKGMTFNQHYSTGNATRAGIFGLFYGLPATYWQSFYENRQSPLLMDIMQQQGYQFGIFASAHLHNPQFDKTVFAHIPNLRTQSKGASVVERDQEITELWLEWDKNRNKNQPAFSFLFYDAPHGYTFPKDYPVQFTPMVKELDYSALSPDYDANLLKNRYMTSVHFDDSLINKVLIQLQQDPDWSNTLVIITGDHGQEINDNQLNYWGHNSNFSDAQTKVPMILVGPNIAVGKQSSPTNHVDLVPTLLMKYFGVTNPIDDYSTGMNMFALQQRQFQLLASYNDYAIVNKDEILSINGINGSYDVLNKHYQHLNKKPNFMQLQQALGQMNRFLK